MAGADGDVKPVAETDRLAVLSAALRGSPYALTLFNQDEVDALELVLKRGKPHLRCFVTGRLRQAKPEEVVRQLLRVRPANPSGLDRETHSRAAASLT